METLEGLTRKEADQLLLDAYRGSGRTFRPLFPWVFVRVLPKELEYKSGLLVLPEKQNKTDHEGVVLATWEPITAEAIKTKSDSEWLIDRYRSLQYRNVAKVSVLRAGDHVMFPHWAGMPIPGFDDASYRVVKEEGWKKDEDGGIYAVVGRDEAEDPYAGISEVIQQYCNAVDGSLGMYAPDIESIMQEIEKNFLVMRRGQSSVTISGR
jgi:co-chaperonin GroES (HSP10)